MIKTLPKLDAKQVYIMLAVMIASFMTGLYSRMFQIALPDLRGVWGLSIDEGSLLNIVALAPQLLLSPATIWLMSVFGPRKTLLPPAILFICATISVPYIGEWGLLPLLIIHGIIAALLGVFITVSILLVCQYLPPPWWIIPIAIYSFRLALTINAGVIVSAVYTEHLGWQWIYWQAAGLMVVYAIIIHFCFPPKTVHRESLRDADWPGMVLFCISMTLLYIGFDQGERLNWFDSGFVVACIGGGAVMLVAFIIHEFITPKPFADLKNILTRNIMLCLMLGGIYGVLVTGNAILVTQFLASIHFQKPVQYGLTLLIVPAIGVVFIPGSIFIGRRLDPRLTFAAGIVLLALGFWQGTFITADWMINDFAIMFIYFGLGHPLTFMGIMTITMANYPVKFNNDILPFVHSFRVLIPGIAAPLFTVFMRWVREADTLYLKETINGNRHAVVSYIESSGKGYELALRDLNAMVQTQATVLATQDCFYLCFWICIIILGILVLIRPGNPSPLTPMMPRGTRGNTANLDTNTVEHPIVPRPAPVKG